MCLKLNMTGCVTTRKQLSLQAESKDASEVNNARKGLRASVIRKGGPTLLLSGFGMSLVKRRSAAPLAAAR